MGDILGMLVKYWYKKVEIWVRYQLQLIKIRVIYW